jgi:hypothetical protein
VDARVLDQSDAEDAGASDTESAAGDASSAAESGVPRTRELCSTSFRTQMGGGSGFGRRQGLHKRNVRVDRDDNLIMVGTFIGTATFGSERFTSEQLASFVLKLDSGCRLLWARAFSGDADTQVQLGAVSTDSAGNIYVGGTFAGVLRLDRLLETGLRRDSMVLAKLTPTGEVSWSQMYGSLSYSGELTGIAVDREDRVLLWGTSASDTSFGGAPVGGGIGQVSFIAQLDANATHRWSRGLTVLYGIDAALAPDDTIAVSGWNLLEARSSRNLGRLSPSGEELWLRPVLLDGVMGGRSESLEVDAQGSIVSARADQFLDADGHPSSATAALEKYTEAGDSVWVRPVPLGTGFDFEDWNADIALDGDGAMLLGLNLDVESPPVEYGGHTFTSRGQDDVLLVKHTPDGEPVWFESFGGELADWTMGLGADSQRDVWLAYGRSTGIEEEAVEMVIVKLAGSP